MSISHCTYKNVILEDLQPERDTSVGSNCGIEFGWGIGCGVLPLTARYGKL